jgi:CRP-like cAMP-binding protein
MQGERANGVFVIREGQVRLVIYSANEQEMFERIHPAGEMVGLLAVFAQGAYSMTAETASESKLSFIPKETLMAAMSDDAKLGFSCLHMLSEEVQTARGGIVKA